MAGVVWEGAACGTAAIVTGIGRDILLLTGVVSAVVGGFCAVGLFLEGLLVTLQGAEFRARILRYSSRLRGRGLGF